MSDATTVYPIEGSVASSQSTAKARLGWVDAARGIAIFLVVLGHAKLSINYQLIFQPFRLPLFYITAGFLFNFERHRGALGPYLMARLRRLVLPYFCTAFFFYLVAYLISYRLLGREFEPAKQFAAIFLASGMVSNDPAYVIWFDLALWFLGCMAVSTIIFVGLIHFYRDEKTYLPMILTSIGIAALGRVIGQRWQLPWSADVAMEAQFFFIMGFLLRQYGVRFVNTRMLAFFGVIYVALYLSGDATDMNLRIYPDFSEFCLAGLAGTYVVFWISKRLDIWAEGDPAIRYVSAPLEFLGRNTMVIMAFHMGGNYLRDWFETLVLGKTHINPEDFWPNLLWLWVASLLAIAVLNWVKPLKRIYYK